MTKLKPIVLMTAIAIVFVLVIQFNFQINQSEVALSSSREVANQVQVDLSEEINAQVQTRIDEQSVTIEQLRNQMKSLEGQLAYLVKLMQHSDISDVQQTSQQQSSQVQAISQAEYNALLEQAYLTEAIDPQWSEESVATIEKAFSEINSVAVESIECATTLCKLTASAAVDADPGLLLTQAEQNLQWSGSQNTSFDPSTGKLVSYFLKQGNEFPKFN
ncbi:MAG: hypothetical protein OEZ58_03555 [Gammaproteobacteria bacterium]|nr:hypothetical protein [Gammaproteobacteria bacterium]MDH5728039.1 hypothetical protein [Gammaproteobacteria bacterium]